MYDTLAKIESTLGNETESVTLEFKDGEKLTGLNDKAKRDLVVDVTAFANAGGGTVIYGISEEQREGLSYACRLSPVTDEKITIDRLREIIFSNTDPPLRDFTIDAYSVEGGRLFVINVAEGDTAYQNKLDFRYYGRVDASSHPLHGFSVRDVMNRRKRPLVAIRFSTSKLLTDPNRHIYKLTPELHNVGTLTAKHWILRLGIPAAFFKTEGALMRHMRLTSSQTHKEVLYKWYEYSPDLVGLGLGVLLPGDSLPLDAAHNYPEIRLEISSPESITAADAAPPLMWLFLLDNAPRQSGEIKYNEWSVW